MLTNQEAKLSNPNPDIRIELRGNIIISAWLKGIENGERCRVRCNKRYQNQEGHWRTTDLFDLHEVAELIHGLTILYNKMTVQKMEISDRIK